MDAQQTFSLEQPWGIVYTTADIERLTFSGDVGGRLGAVPITPVATGAMVLIRILDGEPCLITDAPMPGVARPEPDARLFGYIGA